MAKELPFSGQLMTPGVFMTASKPSLPVASRNNSLQHVESNEISNNLKKLSVESVGKRDIDVAVDGLLNYESPDHGFDVSPPPDAKDIENAIHGLVKITTPWDEKKTVQLNVASLVSGKLDVNNSVPQNESSSHPKWAGGAYRNAPLPSNIPLPSFDS